jgi:hypothetical protein
METEKEEEILVEEQEIIRAEIKEKQEGEEGNGIEQPKILPDELSTTNIQEDHSFTSPENLQTIGRFFPHFAFIFSTHLSPRSYR